MLVKGDTVGIICCSDGRKKEDENRIALLEQVLKTEFSLQVVFAETIFQKAESPFSGTPQDRAIELMKLYQRSDVQMIFDISGGDAANQVLPYLDFDIIRNAQKPFIGYSDLTVILNAIYTKAEQMGYNYQLLHLVGKDSELQQSHFRKTFFENRVLISGEQLNEFVWRGGEVIGGNIRCFLKLAGTNFMPDFTNKIILLESLGGKEAKIASYVAQLEQLGAFSKCLGVIVGQHSEAEENGEYERIGRLYQQIGRKYKLPIFRTSEIGHSVDAKPCLIGAKVNVSRETLTNF
ncbi:LD-carboxypeptidase [Listeria monocytogenes]|uniref:S66 peptidase family protein n=1 Tax=Listeria monocytogenes TaxID=1639 RepID=UPI0012778B15|nr:LD-carboxypeptidase [Listeria monocytogenes]ECL0053842.1 LD-carboxypeptidase [Listeria monocytogenes]ECV6727643.1 LD-carboxypeptidase [Listeria monocytogenes]EGC3020062.1 LD-carboxypeptidase [Listeria monocytogenes]EGF3122772.1 LD-carboxypeptidase [Listeria monocytogenes]